MVFFLSSVGEGEISKKNYMLITYFICPTAASPQFFLFCISLFTMKLYVFLKTSLATVGSPHTGCPSF